MEPHDPDWASRRPHPALRSLLRGYAGYRQEGVTLPVHRGLPGEHVTVVVSLAGPVRLEGMPGSDQGPARLQALVGGLHTGPALIAQDRAQSGIHLYVNPLGVRPLLGVSAPELAGRVVDLAELPRPGLASLADRLHATAGWRERFAVLDEVLLGCVDAGEQEPGPAAEVGRAWRRMRGSGGTLRVGELAAEVGWSRRHFAERFAREVGLPPKQAARVVRFGRATDLLRRRAGGLGEVAQACGYFDQAHLTNEFQALAGCTPGTWVAEELPFLQDPEPVDPGGSGA